MTPMGREIIQIRALVTVVVLLILVTGPARRAAALRSFFVPKCGVVLSYHADAALVAAFGFRLRFRFKLGRDYPVVMLQRFRWHGTGRCPFDLYTGDPRPVVAPDLTLRGIALLPSQYRPHIGPVIAMGPGLGPRAAQAAAVVVRQRQILAAAVAFDQLLQKTQAQLDVQAGIP